MVLLPSLLLLFLITVKRMNRSFKEKTRSFDSLALSSRGCGGNMDKHEGGGAERGTCPQAWTEPHPHAHAHTASGAS